MEVRKIQWKPLLISIAIPLAVGGLSALITKSGMEAFAQVAKPPLTPPDWLFPIAWGILYVLMGIASYLVFQTEETSGDGRLSALTLYAVQLVFNFLWSVFFFNMQWYLFSFAWLVALWVLIFLTMKEFFSLSKTAGYLLLPYLLWVSFAGYLNLGVYLLNR